MFRRIERLLLGAAFGVVAYVLERRVLRAIKRAEVAESPKPGLTAVGGSDGLAVSPEEVQE